MATVHGIDDDKRPNQKKYIQMYQDYKEKVGQFTANIQSPNKIDIGNILNGSTQTQNTAFGG